MEVRMKIQKKRNPVDIIFSLLGIALGVMICLASLNYSVDATLTEQTVVEGVTEGIASGTTTNIAEGKTDGIRTDINTGYDNASGSTSSPDYASFGADFYTYIYKATRIAAQNLQTVASATGTAAYNAGYAAQRAGYAANNAGYAALNAAACADNMAVVAKNIAAATDNLAVVAKNTAAAADNTAAVVKSVEAAAKNVSSVGKSCMLLMLALGAVLTLVSLWKFVNALAPNAGGVIVVNNDDAPKAQEPADEPENENTDAPAETDSTEE